MGCKCGNEFKIANLKLSYGWPRDFVEPQFGGRSVVYVIYRCIVALYFTAVMIYSWTVHEYGTKWVILLTNWTLVLLVITVNLMAILSLKHFIKISKEPNLTDDMIYDRMPVVFMILWICHTILLPAAPLISLFYWGLVYKGWTLTIVNITTHGISTVYVLIDLFINAIPVHVLHFYQPLIFAITYSIFAVIYWVVGGQGENDHTIYSIIDYKNNPGKAIAYQCGMIFVVLPIIYAVMFGLHKLRLCIYTSCGHRSVNSLSESTKDMSPRDQSADGGIVNTVAL